MLSRARVKPHKRTRVPPRRPHPAPLGALDTLTADRSTAVLVSPADFQAWAAATGNPYPQTPQEKAAATPDVLAWKADLQENLAAERGPNVLGGILAAAGVGGLGAGGYGIYQHFRNRQNGANQSPGVGNTSEPPPPADPGTAPPAGPGGPAGPSAPPSAPANVAQGPVGTRQQPLPPRNPNYQFLIGNGLTRASDESALVRYPYGGAFLRGNLIPAAALWEINGTSNSGLIAERNAGAYLRNGAYHDPRVAALLNLPPEAREIALDAIQQTQGPEAYNAAIDFLRVAEQAVHPGITPGFLPSGNLEYEEGTSANANHSGRVKYNKSLQPGYFPQPDRITHALVGRQNTDSIGGLAALIGDSSDFDYGATDKNNSLTVDRPNLLPPGEPGYITSYGVPDRLLPGYPNPLRGTKSRKLYNGKWIETEKGPRYLPGVTTDQLRADLNTAAPAVVRGWGYDVDERGNPINPGHATAPLSNQPSVSNKDWPALDPAKAANFYQDTDGNLYPYPGGGRQGIWTKNGFVPYIVGTTAVDVGTRDDGSKIQEIQNLLYDGNLSNKKVIADTNLEYYPTDKTEPYGYRLIRYAKLLELPENSIKPQSDASQLEFNLADPRQSTTKMVAVVPNTPLGSNQLVTQLQTVSDVIPLPGTDYALAPIEGAAKVRHPGLSLEEIGYNALGRLRGEKRFAVDPDLTLREDMIVPAVSGDTPFEGVLTPESIGLDPYTPRTPVSADDNAAALNDETKAEINQRARAMFNFARGYGPNLVPLKGFDDGREVWGYVDPRSANGRQQSLIHYGSLHEPGTSPARLAAEAYKNRVSYLTNEVQRRFRKARGWEKSNFDRDAFAQALNSASDEVFNWAVARYGANPEQVNNILQAETDLFYKQQNKDYTFKNNKIYGATRPQETPARTPLQLPQAFPIPGKNANITPLQRTVQQLGLYANLNGDLTLKALMDGHINAAVRGFRRDRKQLPGLAVANNAYASSIEALAAENRRRMPGLSEADQLGITAEAVGAALHDLQIYGRENPEVWSQLGAGRGLDVPSAPLSSYVKSYVRNFIVAKGIVDHPTGEPHFQVPADTTEELAVHALSKGGRSADLYDTLNDFVGDQPTPLHAVIKLDRFVSTPYGDKLDPNSVGGRLAETVFDYPGKGMVSTDLVARAPQNIKISLAHRRAQEATAGFFPNNVSDEAIGELIDDDLRVNLEVQEPDPNDPPGTRKPRFEPGYYENFREQYPDNKTWKNQVSGIDSVKDNERYNQTLAANTRKQKIAHANRPVVERLIADFNRGLLRKRGQEDAPQTHGRGFMLTSGPAGPTQRAGVQLMGDTQGQNTFIRMEINDTDSMLSRAEKDEARLDGFATPTESGGISEAEAVIAEERNRLEAMREAMPDGLAPTPREDVRELTPVRVPGGVVAGPLMFKALGRNTFTEKGDEGVYEAASANLRRHLADSAERKLQARDLVQRIVRGANHDARVAGLGRGPVVDDSPTLSSNYRPSAPPPEQLNLPILREVEEPPMQGPMPNFFRPSRSLYVIGQSRPGPQPGPRPLITLTDANPAQPGTPGLAALGFTSEPAERAIQLGGFIDARQGISDLDPDTHRGWGGRLGWGSGGASAQASFDSPDTLSAAAAAFVPSGEAVLDRHSEQAERLAAAGYSPDDVRTAHVESAMAYLQKLTSAIRADRDGELQWRSSDPSGKVKAYVEPGDDMVKFRVNALRKRRVI